MSNMSIYNAFRNTPKEAQKTITGGRLNGFTDISPMYRIQALTEQFGACGIGWYYDMDRKWAEQAGDELLCFVDISLYIKAGSEWSKPIHGTGGSTLVAKERNGLRASDEAYKMATTDALSVACKQLGIGADIYWAKGESKYSKTEPEPKAQVSVECDEVETKRRRTMVTVLLEEYGKPAKHYAEIAKALGSADPRNMTMPEFTDHMKAVRAHLEGK